MIAWIIYFREAAIYNKQYIQFYIEEGAKLGIDVRLILVEELEFGVKNNTWFMNYQMKETTYPDFVICRAIYPLLSKQLELMGIKVFNNSKVSEICNDKARTYQYLAKTGIKMVDTNFFKNAQIKDVLSHLDKPTVMKAVEGHGGSQVFLINPSEVVYGESNSESCDNVENRKSTEKVNEVIEKVNEAIEKVNEVIEKGNEVTEKVNEVTEKVNEVTEKVNEVTEKVSKVIDGLKDSDVVVQPFIGSRHQDLRVYVIGKEIIAAVLRTAKEGFKANFSLGGEVRLYKLSVEEKALVQIITDQFEFGLVGIDFIIGDEGELIFNEIEDVVGSRMLYQCSDIDIVERYLKYIINSIRK